MRMGIVGLILLLTLSEARADWRGHGAMWGGLTQQEQLAYIKGFLRAASLFDAHCRSRKRAITTNPPPSNDASGRRGVTRYSRSDVLG